MLKSVFERIIYRMPFYAVAKGRKIGIYKTWPECESQIKKFHGAIFKKFNTTKEAEEFITQKRGVPYSSSQSEGSINTPSSDEALEIQLKKVKRKMSNNDINSETLQNIEKSCARIEELKRKISEMDGETYSASCKKPKNGTTSKSLIYDDSIPFAKQQNIPTGLKLQKYGSYSFMEDEDKFVHIFTDGSCEGNGRQGACAGLGVYFGEDHALNTAKPVKGRATNNVGEIQAAYTAIYLAKEHGLPKVVVNTDSQFLIKSINTWMTGWKRNGWKTSTGQPVKNKDDFVELDKLLCDRTITVKWKYVEAHKGIIGNERADALARQGSQMYREQLGRKNNG